MTPPADLPVNPLDALIAFYHTLTPATVADFPAYYTAEAYFKDPFNEVRGVAAIERIFRHMFEQVGAPRFVVTEHFKTGDSAMLVWEFSCRLTFLGWSESRVMRGVSHLRLAADGKVAYHRDYWDTGEELYQTLPGLGLLMRGLRRSLAA